MISWFPSIRAKFLPYILLLLYLLSYFHAQQTRLICQPSLKSSLVLHCLRYVFKIFYSMPYTQPLRVIYCTFFIPVISNSNFYIRNKPLTPVFYCPPSSIDPKSTRDPSSCLQSGHEDFSISLPLLPRRNQSIVSYKLHARMVS
jgi:hypothetical protein